MPGQQAAQEQCLLYWAFTLNSTSTVSGEGLPDHETVKTFCEERAYIKEFVFQKERATRDHYQGRLHLNEKKSKAIILQDLSNAGFAANVIQNWTFSAISNNGKAAAALDFYCTKIDTRVAGPWYDAGFKPPKKRKTYEGKDLVCMEEPLDWQTTVIDWVKGVANDRDIRWIWNKAGNAGKSKLIKYLCFKDLAVKVPLGTATQLKTAVCDRGESSAFLVDLPRVSGNQESQRDLFSALEDIKNGFVETAMYGKPRSLFMEPPHVVIFSNDLPDLRFASADRWKVYELADMHDFLHFVSTDRVRAIVAARPTEGGVPGAAL